MKDEVRADPMPDGAWIGGSDRPLPKVLDPVMTMEIVQRYVEMERVRTRRTMLLISSSFLFAILLILSVFIAVGVVVLRNSREAAETVKNMEVQTLLYASEVADISNRVDSLRSSSSELTNLLQQTESERGRDKGLLRSDLERFSRWIAASQSQDSRAIDDLKAQIAGLTEDLRKKTEALAAAPVRDGAQSGGVVPVQPGVSDAVKDTQPVTTEGSGPAEGSTGGGSKVVEVAMVPVDTHAVAVELEMPEEWKADMIPPAPEAAPVLPPAGEREKVSTVTFPNGDRYTGVFSNGLFEGWGEYRYKNGDVYEGSFRSDMKQGRGNLLSINGDKYYGEYRDDRKSGAGTLLFAGGDRYVGEFRDDVIMGKGTFYSRNGDRYMGDFKVGQKHGQGTMVYANGDIFRGQFVEDRRNGKGTYVFSGGAKYIGEFKDGKRHGQGRYIFSSGEEYSGGFIDGFKHGEGVFIYPNGKRTKGLWKEDKLVRTIE